MDNDAQKGLYQKYVIDHPTVTISGSHFFVLDETHDVFAPAAIEAYGHTHGLEVDPRSFYVRRVDGSGDPGEKHANCRYFVVWFEQDRLKAMRALSAYASACEAEYPKLARDLREMYLQ